MLLRLFFCGTLLIELTFSQNPCRSRDYGNGGTVCVCSSTYCDTIPRPRAVPSTQYLVYTSNQAGLRFQQTRGRFRPLNTTTQILFSSESEEVVEIDIQPTNGILIDSTTSFQPIYGFGGAFTDASGINILSLPRRAQDLLLESIFGPNGIEYTFGRVPIGGTDFSTRAYTYDDGREDPQLRNFRLAPEDYRYKIPIILRARTISDGNLRLFCSAWSAPRWMKTNDAYAGYGFLRRSMYQAWANYFVRFLDAYQANNVTFWGMTTANEPADTLYPFDKLEVVGWPSWLLGDWISNNLGPTIRTSNHSNIKIMILDDQRIFLPWYIQRVFRDSYARDYTDGIAVHWYLDEYVPPSVLTRTQQLFPEKFILATEASVMPEGDQGPVVLGSWRRGEDYSSDIIQDLQNWVTGWIDWNLALDPNGGPNYISNFVDAPIIVNATSGEFFKQPLHYHVGHFSKFVPRGSVRIFATPNVGRNVVVVAFQRPDNGTAVVILNKGNNVVSINITDLTRGTASLELTRRSISTILYW